MIYVSPRPVEREFRDTGRGIMALWIEDEPAHRNYWRRRLRDLERHVGGKGKLLDVGCYSGFFLDEARASGWEVWGIEPDPVGARYCRDVLGLANVFKCTLDQAEFPSNYFDVVTLYHVIEHVSSPRSLLSGVAEVLREGGVLVVETPDCGLWMSLMRSKFRYLHPGHNWYFTKSTLLRLLLLTGFELLELGHVGKTVRLEAVLRRWVSFYLPALGSALGSMASRAGLADRLLYLNIGDILIAYATKEQAWRGCIGDLDLSL
jgi:SAM-dependent methyltransferase